MHLDYTLKTAEERIAYVNKILSKPHDDSPRFISYLTDYILFTSDKNQTKKERKADKPIITKNREVTINKRQISFESLVANLENGEDGLYALISDNKNQILDPKAPINQEDLNEIPGMKDQLQIVENLKSQLARTSPSATSARFSLKTQIIETWQQMYLLKASYRGIQGRGRATNQVKSMARMSLPEHITLDEKTDLPVSDGKLSLLNPKHVSFLLCNYGALKGESEEDLQSDMHFLLMDLDDLVVKALLPQYPRLFDLLVWKIDGLTNDAIREKMLTNYAEDHSAQYYSTLWRQRIPALIVEEAQKQWLIWHYTNEDYGYWKTCSKCGEVKLGHPLFFAKNTSKDGFYSQCKCCKNESNK